jgi:hypothetical protein
MIHSEEWSDVWWHVKFWVVMNVAIVVLNPMAHVYLENLLLVLAQGVCTGIAVHIMWRYDDIWG